MIRKPTKFNWATATQKMMISGKKVRHVSFKEGDYLYCEGGEIFTNTHAVCGQKFMDNLPGSASDLSWSEYTVSDVVASLSFILWIMDVLSRIGAVAALCFVGIMAVKVLFPVQPGWHDDALAVSFFCLFYRGFWLLFLRNWDRKKQNNEK